MFINRYSKVTLPGVRTHHASTDKLIADRAARRRPQVRRGTAGGRSERRHRNDAGVRSRDYVV